MERKNGDRDIKEKWRGDGQKIIEGKNQEGREKEGKKKDKDIKGKNREWKKSRG